MANVKTGRPTVMTAETLGKLNEAFALGSTDSQAAFYAGISATALYEYCRENPEFAQRKEALKETPILKARRTVVAALSKPQHAEWYLEKKARPEFGIRQEIEHSGTIKTETKDITELDRIKAEYEERVKSAIQKKK